MPKDSRTKDGRVTAGAWLLCRKSQCCARSSSEYFLPQCHPISSGWVIRPPRKTSEPCFCSRDQKLPLLN